MADGTEERDFNIFLSLWVWIETFSVAAGVCVLMALARLIAWPFDRERKIEAWLYERAIKLILALNPIWDFEIEGEVAPAPPRCVIVGNHVSLADFFLIRPLLPYRVRWLLKEEVFRVPFIGWSFWLVDDVPVRRGNRDSAKQAMHRCAESVARGIPIFFFPEGTRQHTEDRLGPFKPGAFRLAIETNADIVPMVTRGARNAIRGVWMPAPAKGTLHVGAPISTDGLSIDDLDDLIERVRNTMIEMLDAEPPPHADE